MSEPILESELNKMKFCCVFNVLFIIIIYLSYMIYQYMPSNNHFDQDNTVLYVGKFWSGKNR